jgi:hypothetical protein
MSKLFPELTFDEYLHTVQVVGSPIHSTTADEPHAGGLWLYTAGMRQYDRPEMEFYKVPALWAAAAAQYLNHWAFASITSREIEVGHTLRAGVNNPFEPRMIAELSPHPMWAETERACLRLVALPTRFECTHCGSDDPGDKPLAH